MPQARQNQISLDATSTYHCISRCVRRQYLCGVDTNTGKDFSHRRDWIRTRIFELQAIFAIDVCAYAVMSNHAHLVLCVQQDVALAWDDKEVATRWLKLFGGKPLVRSFVAGENLSEAQLSAVSSMIKRYRERLFSISWFMRCLNEPIARWANAEDNVTGRFWEGRFKSQALLDEASVIAAMAYVDLNPIRAAMAETPEESDYTSIQQRVLEQDPKIAARDDAAIRSLPEDLRSAIGRLMPFSDQATGDKILQNPERTIPYEIQDYLELVDWSGRAIIEGKRGSIPDNLPPILDRLEIDPENFVRFINRTQKSQFHGFIGTVKSMRNLAHDFGRSFLKGQAAAAALFSPVASESTFYRIMRAEGQQHHRGRAKKPASVGPPTTHCADEPNAVWCWDITWLPGPVRGQFFFLYLILDLFSRKIVGWEVHENESAVHSTALVQRTVWAEGCIDRPLVLHGDNGSPLKGQTVQAMLGKLGITPSFSRPRVSDDNAFVESLFRTCKYMPNFPRAGFASLAAGRDWVRGFVNGYNGHHLHRGINYVTPDQRHRGEDAEVLAKRHAVYQAARRENPARWSGVTRNWSRPEQVWLNPENEAAKQAA